MERETVITDEKSVLNPQVTGVEVGIRNLRKIKIYPLSVAQQWEMSDLITQALQVFMQRESKNDYEFVANLLALIKDNLAKALTLVTDLSEQECSDLFSEMTNVQMAKIIETIYDINYKPISKNVASLLDKIVTVFPSGRPLPTSASGMDIPSGISQDPGETVA